MSHDIKPSWLTTSYVEKIIQKNISSDAIVKNFTVTPATLRGNNYGATVLRVTVDDQYSFIIKIILANALDKKIVTEFGAHTNEEQVYVEYAPKVHALLRSIGDNEKICAQLYAIDKENEAIILEDLMRAGFCAVDKYNGLDWSHLKATIKSVAKFHACSMVLAEQGMQFEGHHRPAMFREDVPGINILFKNFCECLAEAVKSWPGFEKYQEKLVNLSRKVVEQSINVLKPYPSQVKSLNHGDCWTCNLMFSHDGNGQAVDATLVDFQILHYGLPIFDVMYHFYTSACDEIKFNPSKLTELIEFYHKTLTQTLEQLKSEVKVPSLQEMQQEVHDRKFIAVIAHLVFPITMNKDIEHADLQNLVARTDEALKFRMQCFKEPRVVRSFQHFLPLWDAEGLLNV